MYLSSKRSAKIGICALALGIPTLFAGYAGDSSSSGIGTQLIGGGMVGIGLASLSFAGAGKLAEMTKKKYGIDDPDPPEGSGF